MDGDNGSTGDNDCGGDAGITVMDDDDIDADEADGGIPITVTAADDVTLLRDCERDDRR